MSVTLYILEFVLCSAVFVALYKLFIEGRVSYRYSRIYLVLSMVFSAVVPMLELPLYPAQTIYYELPIITYEQPVEILPSADIISPSEPMPEPEQQPIDWGKVAGIVAASIYGLIVMLNLARFAWRLWLIRKLRRHCELTIYEAYTLALSDHISEPFSFWRTVYMNRHLQGRERQHILTHELSHVSHHHTAERLTLELMRCVFWFNPFVWIAGSLLVQVQEWQADKDVIDAGYDVYEYRNFIFRQLYGVGPEVDLTSGLHSKLTKKRFLMMTDFKKGRFQLLRMVASVPVMAAMILAFGAVKAEDKIVYNSPSQISEFIVEESETSGLMQVENSKIEQDTVKDKYPPTVKYPAGIVVPENEKQIILNKGTYEVMGIAYTSAEYNKTPVDVVILVLNDSKMAIKNKSDWKFVESGTYSYVLTNKRLTIARDNKQFTFDTKYVGPAFKSSLKIFTPDDSKIRSLDFVGPMESRDSSVMIGFKYGKVYLNGKETSIQELREVHHINFAAPTVDLGRVKQTPSIGDIIEKNTSQTVSEKEKTEPEESPNVSVAQSSTVKNNTKIYLPSGYDTKHEWTKVPMDKREPIFQTIPIFEFLDDSQVQIKSPKTNTYITSGLYKYEFKGGKLYLKGEHDYVFPFKKSFDGDANEHLNIYINTELYGVKIKYVSLSLVNK
ncbi:MAG: M56 family metallopeptidase [Alistipes sp.]|nr:M56 family metallopeptidase [Alistipes sp.]